MGANGVGEVGDVGSWSVSAAVSVGAVGAVGVGVICVFRDVGAAVEPLTSVYWTRINEVIYNIIA